MKDCYSNLKNFGCKKLFLGIILGSWLITACSHSRPSRVENLPEKNDPVVLIPSNYKIGQIEKACAERLQGIQLQLDTSAQKGVGELAPILKFEEIMAEAGDALAPLTFMASVSTDEKVSAEAAKCESDVGQFIVEVYTRRDIYDRIKASSVKTKAERRLLKETLEEFEKNGLKLSDQKLAEVRKLKSQLTVLETDFSNNLNKEQTQIMVAEKDLEGVPANYVSSLKVAADGNKILNVTEADYPIVMQNAKKSELREKMMKAYLTRGGEKNLELLDKAIELRQQIASLMGFKTWADYKMQKRMAGNSQTVIKFLDSLKAKLSARNKSDFQELLKFKKTLEPAAKELNQWDVLYLNYQMKKRNFHIDNEKIREYFPAETVIQGMFAIYSEMLGVTFKEIKNFERWSSDIQLFEVHDQKTQELLGYFFTDFYPRKGKYDHAAAFPLISGRMKNGTYVKPVSAIVANLTPGMNGQPALLDHDDVMTLFHEFGHIMHQTLTRAPFASLSGSNVAQDFVEAPSQMLENWVWSPEMLKKLSAHYQRPQEKLPDTLLSSMIQARDFHRAIYYTRQLLYGIFDMELHGKNQKLSVNEIFLKLYQEITGQKPAAGTMFPASFGHLMGGYDAGYYGYLWSEVFAADMFTMFPKKNLTDPQVGSRYRKMILENGNMEDGDKLLKQFLGRNPNPRAFFKKLRIQ